MGVKQNIAKAVAAVVMTASNFGGQTAQPNATPVEAVRNQTIQVNNSKETTKAGKQESDKSQPK